jgi:hypothetical protein
LFIFSDQERSILGASEPLVLKVRLEIVCPKTNRERSSFA